MKISDIIEGQSYGRRPGMLGRAGAMFRITDDAGHTTDIIKPTERAARIAWQKRWDELVKTYNYPQRTIIKIEKII